MPIDLLTRWLQEERTAGAPNPQQAVLSTATRDAVPHARVVAIRDINSESLLFFTQRNTRKVGELTGNPVAVITFWFELLQREVIVEGSITALMESENAFYWQSYPREAKIRFCSYAPTSSQGIANKQLLEDKRRQIEQDYTGKPIPISDLYCGFRLQPARFVFYAYRSDELSDVMEYSCIDGQWVQQILSP